MHVEFGDNARGGLTAAPFQQVLSQSGGEIGLPRATGARQNQPSVLQKQTYVVLHHGLWDERLKHQTVRTLLLKTWNSVRLVEPEVSDKCHGELHFFI